MRIRSLFVVSILALVAAACAPRHPYGPHHGGPGWEGHHGYMSPGCGPGSCTYKSGCFSEGAAHSNDGVCQACNGGRWVPAEGCSEHHCGGCCGHGGCMEGHGGCMDKKGKGDMPCMQKRHGGPPHDHDRRS